MRLFLAIRPSDEMNKALIGVLHDCKQKGIKGSYVPASNLHMTLVFIGELPSAEPVRAAMDQVPVQSFRLSLDGAGNFGDLLYASLKSGQKLKAYIKGIRTALDAAGIPYDKQTFVPHITLIRKAAGGSFSSVAIPKTDMMVDRISLMKSETKNGKTVYTEIYSVTAR